MAFGAQFGKMPPMSHNSFGKLFRVTSFGESHGTAIGCIIDGCPPNLALCAQDIQPDLNRRKPGTSKNVTPRREDDAVEILSGVFEGKTTGTPIALIIHNTDQRSQDYGEIARTFRPGHADYTYYKKYGHRDYRGGGRSSARETAMRVAAGAIAKKYLQQHCNMQIRAYLAQMGDVRIEQLNWHEREQNPFFCPDAAKVPALEALIKSLRQSGDSIGARINAVIDNVPAGLGEPIFSRLDADISLALMSINAVKAVEIGAGFDCVTQKGSEHRDQMRASGFMSNHAGGILGGISTGQQILTSCAFKPTSSINMDGDSVDIDGNNVTMRTRGRHDPCVGLRAVPIVEAMLALVMMDHLLRHRAQCGDVATTLTIPPCAE